MAIVLTTPAIADLASVVEALRLWQHDDLPLQLHPGDIGWFWRFGAEAVAASIRIWTQDDEIVAVGLLDGADTFRMTVAPRLERNAALANEILHDVTHPERGVLADGEAYLEAPEGALIKDLLSEAGWAFGDAWTPLRRDLATPVEDSGIRTIVVGAESAHLRVDLQRAAFEKSIFTVEAWNVMSAAPPYADARCLVGFDDDDIAVAAITVWSAGAGRPGLIEPMGVHPDHRGRGYGRAVTIAGAAALRDLGSSSALVCTPSANAGAVNTYRSAGFEPQRIRTDRARIA